MVNRVDRFPVGSGGASQRVDAKLEARALNRIHVHNVSQVTDVREDEVFLMGSPSLSGCGEGYSFHACIVSPQQLVGSVLHPARYVRVGGTAVCGVVLEATILGWVMRRRDHNAVREVLLAAAVVDENGPRDN